MGAEIAKDFLWSGRDKNRITQTQKQSLLVLSPHVLFVSRYSMSLYCCLDTRRDTEEKTLRWKNKTHTHTHTHIHTKGRENKEKLIAEKKVDQVGIWETPGIWETIESLEGITFILQKDNKTHHLRNKEILRTIKPQKPAKVTLDNAQISSIRDGGMNMRAYPAKYVTLQQYFSHPSLVIYFFPTPPIKLKLGLQIGVKLLITTHLDQSNYLAN